MRPHDPRYTSTPLAGASGVDATVAYVAMRSPPSNTSARYENAERRGNENMMKSNKLFFSPWETIHEANPREILERKEKVALVPFLILAIALSAFLGPSLSNAMIAIGVTATPVFVRLTRGQTLSAKVEDYVEAARAVGNPHWRIALRHVLPNIVPPLLVQASLAIAGAIIAEAALSFLGLGQQPPSPSWGSMLNSAQRFIAQAPWMAFWPGFAIFIAVLSFNLLGDGLRDALDPRHK